MATEAQSDRHPRVPSIWVGKIFCVPDFKKLPYSLCSQGIVIFKLKLNKKPS